MEEEQLDEDEPKLRDPLPDIPDYPDAPLPAWKHYGITKHVSDQIVQELINRQYPGYMIGLNLQYAPGQENAYSMSFGKLDVQLAEEEEEPEVPLSDEFLLDVYQTVNGLIAKNVPGSLKEFDSEVTVVLTGSERVVRIACTVPDRCDRGHVNKRCCKKINSGPWRCLHERCRR